MALQAGGWFSIGLATYTGRPGQASPALGLILAGAATVLLVPAVTALVTKVLAALVMLLTSLRFYLTAAYELSSAAGWKMRPASLAWCSRRRPCMPGSRSSWRTAAERRCCRRCARGPAAARWRGTWPMRRPGFITRQAYAGNCSHRPQ
jgi:hypothetical protein